MPSCCTCCMAERVGPNVVWSSSRAAWVRLTVGMVCTASVLVTAVFCAALGFNTPTLTVVVPAATLMVLWSSAGREEDGSNIRARSLQLRGGDEVGAKYIQQKGGAGGGLGYGSRGKDRKQVQDLDAE